MKELRIPQYLDGRTGDKTLSKAVNRALLLNVLRKRGASSRASLAKMSGLHKVTVSSQIAELIELGIVKETGTGESELGRKPIMLEIAGESGYALGISISTAGLVVVAMDLAGRTDYREFIPLEAHSPEAVLEAILSIIRKAKRRYRKSKFGLFGIGIAVPGAIDRTTGRVAFSAKLEWENVPFRENLSKHFGGILHIGNDATLATIAEHELCAPESDDFVCLLIDEGIGSGAFINGAIHYGHNGQFGEVGHMTIVHNGLQCPCGNTGCWDLYGSELALRQALGIARGGDIPDTEELVALAASPPAWSQEAFSNFIGYLITGIVSIMNAMSPSTLVVNSNVLSASPAMFETLRAGVTARALAHTGICEIRLSSLAKDAPAIGAAMAAIEGFYEELVVKND
ncbi:MAG TPA: ROK family protein [Rectinema sp.]|mgnify:FL=1|nr:ROK family protein [Rectinema sp.]HQQ32133.1 ROK family protein [Rectinema sp.]